MTLKIGKLKYNYFLNKALLKAGNVTHLNVLYAVSLPPCELWGEHFRFSRNIKVEIHFNVVTIAFLKCKIAPSFSNELPKK